MVNLPQIFATRATSNHSAQSYKTPDPLDVLKRQGCKDIKFLCLDNDATTYSHFDMGELSTEEAKQKGAVALIGRNSQTDKRIIVSIDGKQSYSTLEDSNPRYRELRGIQVSQNGSKPKTILFKGGDLGSLVPDGPAIDPFIDRSSVNIGEMRARAEELCSRPSYGIDKKAA